MLERVLYALHEGMGGMKRASKQDQCFVEFLGQRFRLFAPDRQFVSGRLVFNLPFDVVQLPIYLNNLVAQVVVFPTGMSAAANLSLGTVLEESVKTACGIGLYKAGEAFEKPIVSSKRQIRGEIKDVERVLGVTTIDGNFAFAHGTPGFPVLNFDRAVVRLNDIGGEHLQLKTVVEGLKGEGTGLEPIAQRRARNDGVFPFENFRLAILRQPIRALIHDCRTEQARSGQSAGNWRAGLFSSNDILLALWAGANFLLVLKPPDGMNDLLKLVGNLVADKDSFDTAIRTEQIFGLDEVWYGLSRDILKENMPFVFSIFGFSGRSRGATVGLSRSGVMTLGCRSVVFAIALFSLGKQLVKPRLQIEKQGAQFGITFQRQLQLLLKVGDCILQIRNGFVLLGVFFSESVEFLAA